MDKIKVKVMPNEFGEVRDITMEEIRNAFWSDHPGTGHAVLLPNEHGAGAEEVLSPLKFAPPIGYQPTLPIEELVRQRVVGELVRLRDSQVVDTVEDAEDFEIDDELPPLETVYEVLAMKPDVPPMPKVDPKEELSSKAKGELDFWEAVDRERLLRKRHREETLRSQQEELNRLYGDGKESA